jgi:hypothetical protein
VIVVIQAIFAVVRDINVRPAVVVIVTDRDAKSPPFVGYASLLRYVGERSIVVVVKQRGVGAGAVPFTASRVDPFTR